MADPVLLDSGFVGWDNPVVGPTATITTASRTPGSGKFLVLLISVVAAGTSQFTATAPAGGSLTWSVKEKTNAAATYNPCSGIWTAPCNNAGAFSVQATFACGTSSDFNIYKYEWWACDADPTTPTGGVETTQAGAGNGAVSITLDAAPAAGDWVLAQNLTDENTNNQFSTFGAGTWTLKTAGNDLNGDGTTTDTSGHQLAFNGGFRTGSTSPSVPWADVNSGADNFGSTQAAVVVKAASAGGATGTVAVTLAADAAAAAGTSTVTGTVAVTLAADVAAASDGNTATGTIAVTLAADAAAAAGTSTIVGTAAPTLGADVSSAAGKSTIVGTVAVTLAPDVGVATEVLPFPVPTSIGTDHRLKDQYGATFLYKGMSSWAMAMRLSTAQITAALEGLKANGKNSVEFAMCGGVATNPDLQAVQYEDVDGNDFFDVTPFQVTAAGDLGNAWAKTDWIISECLRLEMVAIPCLFLSFADSGSIADMEAATTTHMRTFGQLVGARYDAFPNIMWEIMGDNVWGASSTLGRRVDYFARGLDEGRTSYPNLWMAESFPNTTDGSAPFLEDEGTDPTGYQWWHLAFNGMYWYHDDNVVNAENVYAYAAAFGTRDIAAWDSEPPYAHSNRSTLWTDRQFCRLRTLTVFVEGFSGSNYGDEDWWGFDKPNAGSPTAWTTVLASAESADDAHNNAIIDAYIADDTWAPTSSFVTAGEGTGDNKAAQGASDTAALALFPNNRTGVQVDTTIIAGTAPVRLRWFDVATGTFTTIASSEAQQTGRSVTIPAARGDGTRDWLLVVDSDTANDGTIAVTLAADTSSAAGTTTVTGTVAVTLGADTSSAAGTTPVNGTVGVTLGADVSSATGSPAVVGTIAVTLAADGAAAAGTTTIVGTAAVTLAPDIGAASDDTSATGTIAVTLAADTASAAGSPTIVGTAAVVLAPDVGAAAGPAVITGTIDVTLAPDAAAAAGTSTITGTVAVTLTADVGAATDGAAITGTIAVTLNPDVGLAVEGAIVITGPLTLRQLDPNLTLRILEE